VTCLLRGFFTATRAPAGLQAQTAECLVVGEIAARDMVVALNKIDQVVGMQHP
jgi:translation initiation factor IF-2